MIGTSLGVWIAMALIGRKRASATKRGVFVCGLRVISGRQKGLSAEWLVGEWSVVPGQLRMGTVAVPVVEIVAGTRRPARLSEIVGGAGTIVVTVRTETAVLEWSMMRRFDGLALRSLGAPESSATELAGR
ncbi:MAG: hypothetical protein ABWX92_05205 [Mycetocola sp.]